MNNSTLQAGKLHITALHVDPKTLLIAAVSLECIKSLQSSLNATEQLKHSVIKQHQNTCLGGTPYHIPHGQICFEHHSQTAYDGCLDVKSL